MRWNPLDELVAAQRNATHDVDHMAVGQRTMAGDRGAVGKRTNEVPFMWTDTWQDGTQPANSMSTMGTCVCHHKHCLPFCFRVFLILLHTR